MGYSLKVTEQAEEIAAFLKGFDGFAKKQHIMDAMGIQDTGRPLQSIKCAIDYGFIVRVGVSASTRFIHSSKHTESTEKDYNQSVKDNRAEQKKLWDMKQAQSRKDKRAEAKKERQKKKEATMLADKKQASKLAEAKQKAKKYREDKLIIAKQGKEEEKRIAKLKVMEKARKVKDKKELKAKLKADKLRREKRDLAIAKEEQKEKEHRENFIKSQVERVPPMVKAKFIREDEQERKAAKRNVGIFYWFKAEKNGGDCIGARA